jgi:hypothetical protein
MTRNAEASDTVIQREEIEVVISNADGGDVIRVDHTTGLPEQSALQPDQTYIERNESGRWSYVTMFGTPLWFDDDELIQAIASADYAESIEVVN